jgi:hypothetical protein
MGGIVSAGGDAVKNGAIVAQMCRGPVRQALMRDAESVDAVQKIPAFNTEFTIPSEFTLKTAIMFSSFSDPLHPACLAQLRASSRDA